MDTEPSPNGAAQIDPPFSIDDIIAEATPQERSTRICVNGALRARYEDLEKELQAATEGRKGEPSEEASILARQVEDARAEIQRYMRKFTFRSIGANWTAIRMKHVNAQDIVPDVAAYVAELFEATAVHPVMTVEKARLFIDRLSHADMNELFETAQRANFESTAEVPKSLLASEILEAGHSSTS